MSEIDVLMAHAAQARADADSATLDNVRDRCLRSEAAWLEMAERVRRTAVMRREHEAAKAARPAYVRGSLAPSE